MVTLIDNFVLGQLSRDAAGNPRRRRNLNLHTDFADPCQRLFNAVEPGSYIRPHRHTDPPKPECFVAVRGRFRLLVFSADGDVRERIELSPTGPVLAAEVPPGTWHTIVALDPGSVFFEVKPGPYVPLADKDFAPWSPPEGSAEAQPYLQTLFTAAGSAT